MGLLEELAVRCEAATGVDRELDTDTEIAMTSSNSIPMVGRALARHWNDESGVFEYVSIQRPETWESIAAWCEETFGPCGAHRMAERAMEEGAELLDETSGREVWTDKARIEVADMLICLSRVPGIWSAVEEKMAINRARTWDLRGDGTGYHVKGRNA